MRRNKIFFLVLFYLFFSISSQIISGNFLSPEKFFTFTQGFFIREKEVPVPKEVLFLPEVSNLPEDKNDLQKRIWKEGIVLNFSTFPNNETPSLKSRCAICFDRNYIYICFFAEKSVSYKLKAHRYKQETGRIWNDDNFEVFLDPFLSRSRYYHLIINSFGEIYDAEEIEKLVPDPKATDPFQKMREIKVDATWKSNTSVWTNVEENNWCALVKIPFTAFGLKSAPLGSCWGADFCHTNWENNELTQWKVTPGGFQQPKKFGAIIFGKEKKKNIKVAFSLPLIGYGNNLLHLRFDNQGKKKVSKVVVILSDSKGEKISEIKKRILIPCGKEEVFIPFSIPLGERKEFQLTSWIKFCDFSKYFVKHIYLSEPLHLHLKTPFIYSTDKQIEGSLRINLGEKSLQDIKLRFEISNQKKRYFTELKEIKNNYLKFGITPSFLSGGEYLLKITAIKGRKEIISCSERISVVTPPFSF